MGHLAWSGRGGDGGEDVREIAEGCQFPGYLLVKRLSECFLPEEPGIKQEISRKILCWGSLRGWWGRSFNLFAEIGRGFSNGPFLVVFAGVCSAIDAGAC